MYSHYVFYTDLHSRDANRKSSSRLLFPLIDEFKQPGDGTGDYPQSLQGHILTYHGVGLTWNTETVQHT